MIIAGMIVRIDLEKHKDKIGLSVLHILEMFTSSSPDAQRSMLSFFSSYFLLISVTQ